MSKKPVLFSLASLVVAAAGAPAAHGAIVFAVTQQQHLVSWDSARPGVLLSAQPIVGMQPNELVMGIDTRPDGTTYLLGSFNRLYTVDKGTAQASPIGDPMAMPPGGSNFGFDINPVTNRVRVVSNTNRNYSFDPADGSFVVATDLAYVAGDPNFGADPNIVHAAYRDNSMDLFDIDTGLDVLVQQNNGTGQLTTIGSLGHDVTELGGFDILDGVGYFATRDAQLSRSTFYSVNLATGASTIVGQVAGGEIIVALTVVPTPGSASLLAVGTLAAMRRRRR